MTAGSTSSPVNKRLVKKLGELMRRDNQDENVPGVTDGRRA